MVERIVLKNFTVFKDLDTTLSPGINVIIGQNATGKTHLLKIIYTVIAAHKEKVRISDKIAGVFLPEERRIERLVRRTKGSTSATIQIYIKGKAFSLNFPNHAKGTITGDNGWEGMEVGKPVYIPVKEMLAHAPGFLSLYQAHNIHFEETYRDILSNAYFPAQRGPLDAQQASLLSLIQKVIEGEVIQKGDAFFLKSKEGELEFTLLAEGMRKLGLLWLLIQNGSLLEGSFLFWDELEANLNPQLFGTLIDILLELQRMKVQVFLTTHEYGILKQLDLRRKEGDDIVFHSLHHDEETGVIKYHRAERYLDIHPNAIAEAFADLYDLEVKRALKGDAP